jgi:hypothetical protein
MPNQTNRNIVSKQGHKNEVLTDSTEMDIQPCAFVKQKGEILFSDELSHFLGSSEIGS